MPKVLIVEDEESLRDVYREAFELEEFTVETANDGQEGVEKVNSFQPDIILLDLFMPKMSGFDFLKYIKENPPSKKAPIVVITNINPDVQDLVQNWGVSHFILKADNTPGQIVEKTRAALER